MKKNGIKLILILLLLNTNTSFSKSSKKLDKLKPAYALLNRILPDHYDQFKFKIIESDSENDVYELETIKDKIVISGNKALAITRGLNHYLKHICNAQISWQGINLILPKKLPHIQNKIRNVSEYKYRYMFNYCTFSYSMAFWGWNDWERMIDWMALNGINMPLAILGQEKVWIELIKKFGLNKKDLDDFFVGLGYNAWGRMGNIDAWGGPLSQQRIDAEYELQKKILKREREFGMTPILQGFSGHIPLALIKKHQNIKIHELSWCDFPKTYLLDWTDPLFSKIGYDFIKLTTKLYGTDHLRSI
jgi:alpha-N-acetylglucosaminidase